MRRIIAPLLVCIGMAMPYLKSVEVLPTRAVWSGWTHWQEPNNWVGQTFIANFDSVAYCELFVGDLGANPTHAFNAEVRDYESNTLVALAEGAQASRGHVWLKFDLETQTDQKFVRGKEYIAKFTRPGDSINYYYGQETGGGPYKYGEMVVGGSGHADKDLCLLIYGSFGDIIPNYRPLDRIVSVVAPGLLAAQPDLKAWWDTIRFPGGIGHAPRTGCR